MKCEPDAKRPRNCATHDMLPLYPDNVCATGKREGNLRNSMGHIIEECAPDIDGKYDREQQLWVVEQIARSALSGKQGLPYPGPRKKESANSASVESIALVHKRLEKALADIVNLWDEDADGESFCNNVSGRIETFRELVQECERASEGRCPRCGGLGSGHTCLNPRSSEALHAVDTCLKGYIGCRADHSAEDDVDVHNQPQLGVTHWPRNQNGIRVPTMFSERLHDSDARDVGTVLQAFGIDPRNISRLPLADSSGASSARLPVALGSSQRIETAQRTNDPLPRVPVPTRSVCTIEARPIGEWLNETTWCCGCVPNSGENLNPKCNAYCESCHVMRPSPPRTNEMLVTDLPKHTDVATMTRVIRDATVEECCAAIGRVLDRLRAQDNEKRLGAREAIDAVRALRQQRAETKP